MSLIEIARYLPLSRISQANPEIVAFPIIESPDFIVIDYPYEKVQPL